MVELRIGEQIGRHISTRHLFYRRARPPRKRDSPREAEETRAGNTRRQLITRGFVLLSEVGRGIRIRDELPYPIASSAGSGEGGSAKAGIPVPHIFAHPRIRAMRFLKFRLREKADATAHFWKEYDRLWS